MSFLLKIGKKCSDITLGKILLILDTPKITKHFRECGRKDEEVVSNCKAYAHIRSNQILMIPECATCVTNMYSSMYPDTYQNVSCTTPYITRWLMIWPSFAVNVSICKGLMHFGFLAKKRCHYHLLPFFTRLAEYQIGEVLHIVYFISSGSDHLLEYFLYGCWKNQTKSLVWSNIRKEMS